MFGTHDLTLFLVSAILLNLTPGQDTFYIIGRSVSQGRRAGFLSVAGIISGCVIHTLAAGFGLSAVLATSATAFWMVKLAGAGYLVYLGVRMILERSSSIDQAESLPPESSWAIYRSGFLTNVLNPKVTLFFLGFLPQFVVPSTDSTVLPFLFLGSLFICTGTLWCLVLAWSASTISQRLKKGRGAGVVLKRAAGVLFIGLGVRVAASK